jgi:hypothetical protein
MMRPTFPLFIVLLVVVTTVTASDDLGSPAVATSGENDAANGTGNFFLPQFPKFIRILMEKMDVNGFFHKFTHFRTIIYMLFV